MAKIKINENDKVIEEKQYDSDLLNQYMNEYAKAEETIIEYAYNKTEIFKASNIVGEYAELLACEALGLEKVGASEPEFDAVLNGKKYQIKSRWYNTFGSGSGKNEFGSITDGVIANVDYVVLVVFLGNDFNNVRIYELETSNVFKLREAYEQNAITSCIVSKRQSGYKYKIYFNEEGFDQAINLGLMRRVR